MCIINSRGGCHGRPLPGEVLGVLVGAAHEAPGAGLHPAVPPAAALAGVLVAVLEAVARLQPLPARYRCVDDRYNDRYDVYSTTHLSCPKVGCPMCRGREGATPLVWW